MIQIPKLGIAVVAAAAICVSLSVVLSRLAYDAGTNPLTLMSLRTLAFIAFFGLVARARGRSLALPPRARRTSYGLGIAYLIGTGGYLFAILTLPVSLAVLIFYSYPLMTLLLAAALARKRPRLIEALAFLIAFVGLGLALEVSFVGLHAGGIAFALAGALGIAVAFVGSARTLGDFDTLSVTFHMTIAGFVVVTAVTLVSGSFAFPTGGAGGWLVLLAVVVTFVAGFFAMFQGVRLIGPVRTAMVMNLEPVVTILLAMAVLSESMTLRQGLGALLVVSAILAAQWRSGVGR